MKKTRHHTSRVSYFPREFAGWELWGGGIYHFFVCSICFGNDIARRMIWEVIFCNHAPQDITFTEDLVADGGLTK